MFQLRQYKTWPTGFTDFEIRFNTGFGEVQDKRSYFCEADAIDYINSCKLSYILILFGRLVKHANDLSENGHKAFYKTPVKVHALERCNKAYAYFLTKDVKEICETILQMESLLFKILPSPADPTFLKTESRLMDIIVFSKKECNVIRAFFHNQIPTQ